MLFANTVYVDPSISAGGDGTTPATALKALPQCNSLQDDTMYLIRRTAESSASPILGNSQNSSMNRLGIVGMPKSGDPRYQEMPAAAQTAWGADSADKAQLTVDGGNYFQFSNLYDFELYGINLLRTATVSGNPAFYLNTNRDIGYNYYGTAIISKCRFAGKDEPIDDVSYTAAPTFAKGSGWFRHSGRLSNATVADNEICFTQDTSNGGTCITLYRIHNSLQIRGNNMYGITAGNSQGSGSCAFIYQSSDTSLSDFFCTDNHVRIRRTTGRNYPGGIWIDADYHAKRGIVKNFSYSEGSHFAMPDRLGMSYGALRTPLSFFCEYENIDVTLENLWQAPYCNCVFLRGQNANSNSAARNFAKNISIRLADAASGLGDRNNDDTFNSTSSDTRANYFALKMEYLAEVRNINIRHTAGKGLYVYYCNVDDAAIEGVVNLNNCVANLTGVTTNRNQYAVNYGEYVYCSIDTLTVDLETPSNNPVVREWSENSFNFSNIFIGSSNKLVKTVAAVYPSSTNSYLTGEQTGGSVAVNNNGAEGRVNVYHVYCTVDTWATGRQGGSENSLKFQNSAQNYRNAVPVGSYPGAIMMKSNLSSGKHTVSAYIAFIGLDRFEDKFWIELESDKGFYDSRSDGAWVDDDSVWQGGGAGLTLKKFVCDIEFNQPGSLKARVYYRGYSPSGFLYLDPVFTVA